MRTALALTCALLLTGVGGLRAAEEKDTHEALIEAMIGTLKEHADILETVKDKEGLDAAQPKIKKIEAKRKELAQAHAGRAVGFLRQAVKHGFKDSARLQHPAFEQLRSRDDFGKLLRDLDAPRGRP